MTVFVWFHIAKVEYEEICQLSRSFHDVFTFFCQQGLLEVQNVCDFWWKNVLKERAAVQDGYGWRCTEWRCHRWVSICRNSFFQGSHISLVKWLHVIYFWSHDDSNHRIQHMSGLSNNTVGKMFKALRSVCSNKIATNLIRIGGPGHIVEIDESKFGHKQKYHHGRFGEGPWVFGAIDRVYKTGHSLQSPKSQTSNPTADNTVPHFAGNNYTLG